MSAICNSLEGSQNRATTGNVTMVAQSISSWPAGNNSASKRSSPNFRHNTSAGHTSPKSRAPSTRTRRTSTVTRSGTGFAGRSNSLRCGCCSANGS